VGDKLCNVNTKYENIATVKEITKKYIALDKERIEREKGT